MVHRLVEVRYYVSVTVDESKFTDQFMKEFNEIMYPLPDVDAHIQNLAKLYSRGVIVSGTDFVEGYGNLSDFDVKFELHSIETDIIEY